MSLARQARVSVGLGILSLLAVLLCHLALTDIWHGEQDVTLEWNVVRAAFLAIVAFQLSALATLRRVLRERPNRSPITGSSCAP